MSRLVSALKFRWFQATHPRWYCARNHSTLHWEVIGCHPHRPDAESHTAVVCNDCGHVFYLPAMKRALAAATPQPQGAKE